MNSKPEHPESVLPEDVRRTIASATAELRHAYTHLAAGRVVNQKSLADGLIAPQIRRLESLYAGVQPTAPAETEGVGPKVGS